MLQYGRIYISEISKCDICHNWYFKDIGYKYEPHVCNKWLDLLMVVYDLKKLKGGMIIGGMCLT